jgi:hypothetical protein
MARVEACALLSHTAAFRQLFEIHFVERQPAVADFALWHATQYLEARFVNDVAQRILGTAEQYFRTADLQRARTGNTIQSKPNSSQRDGF